MNLKLYLYTQYLCTLGHIIPSTAVSPQSAFAHGRGKFPKKGEGSEVLRAKVESRDESRMWGWGSFGFVSSSV